jgi:hypothetical protein
LSLFLIKEYLKKGLLRPFLVLIVSGGFSYTGSAQKLADRIHADFSIKEIGIDGKQALVMGQVYYDINLDLLIQAFSFPSEQIIIYKDESSYIIKNDSVFEVPTGFDLANFSIYYLSLSNSLQNFGLEKNGFKLSDVEERNGKTLSHWNYSQNVGAKLVVVQEGMNVDGVMIYDPDGNLLMRQYYRDYQSLGSIAFPSKVYEIVPFDDKENRKIITHTNVKIDEQGTDIYAIYDDVVLPWIQSTGQFKIGQ